MNTNEQIKQMINMPYKSVSLPNGKAEIDIEFDREVCWTFCRHIFDLYGIKLSEFPHKGIRRVEQNQITIPSIVLFCGSNWHSGIVWPDGLHFIHTNFEIPLESEKNHLSRYIVRKERLTCWPWNILIEGFYTYVV